jgi:hypothetical protein
MRKIRNLICIMLFIYPCIEVYSQNWITKPNILILDISKDSFYGDTKQQGWDGNLVASSSYQVASININVEVKIFSNDGYILFYLPQKAASYSIIRGYLQVANFNQKDNKITLLDKIYLTEKVPEKLFDDIPPVVIIELTREKYSEKANDLGWITNHTISGENQVASINYNFYSPVYSSDGYLLFYLVKGAVEYSIKTMSIELANYDQKNSVINLGKIVIKKVM